jgi:serine/threonine protein kinase
LKPANILLKPDCTALICDFGLSRTLPDSCSNRSQQSIFMSNSS